MDWAAAVEKFVHSDAWMSAPSQSEDERKALASFASEVERLTRQAQSQALQQLAGLTPADVYTPHGMYDDMRCFFCGADEGVDHKDCPRDPVNGWTWIAEIGATEPSRACGGCKSTTWNREPMKRGRKPKRRARGAGEGDR